MIWHDMIRHEMKWFLKFALQSRAWSDTRSFVGMQMRTHHCAAFRAQMYKPKAAQHYHLRARMKNILSTVSGAIFPEWCRARRLLSPVHRRIPAKPQLLLLTPIPLSTFVFASSSPAWARRGAEEPRLQAARLWKGLTCFQDACCLDVQACQQT